MSAQINLAALLARHPEPWTVGYLGGVYDADGATVGGRDNGPSAATLVPLLATALREALGLGGEPNTHNQQESHT